MKKLNKITTKELKGMVYKITSPSNKIYIGSTKNKKQRWESYTNLKCKSQPRLYRSFVKYGVENHIFEVIWEGPVEEMLKMERTFGDQFNVLDGEFGLNCILPGYDDVQCVVSEETKNKISKSLIGKYGGEKHPMYGLPVPIERREKISKGCKNYKHTPEQNLAKSIRQKGTKKKPRTKEHSAKLGKIHRKIVLQYDLDGNFIKEWESPVVAGNESGFNRFCISSAATNDKNKTHKGYMWRYKIEENIPLKIESCKKYIRIKK